MRSFVSKSSKHFPIEWSLNSATDFGPSPSSPTLLALSSNGCHQASSHLKLHFFFPLQKYMFSSFFRHLLTTYYLPSPILGTSLFSLLAISSPPSLNPEHWYLFFLQDPTQLSSPSWKVFVKLSPVSLCKLWLYYVETADLSVAHTQERWHLRVVIRNSGSSFMALKFQSCLMGSHVP